MELKTQVNEITNNSNLGDIYEKENKIRTIKKIDRNNHSEMTQ